MRPRAAIFNHCSNRGDETLIRHSTILPARIFAILIYGLIVFAGLPSAARADSAWEQAAQYYQSGNYPAAAAAYQSIATNQFVSADLMQNLGNAEWKSARTGAAILAWERASWLNPRQSNARNNLKFARRSALLEEPELRWFEFCSTWLPANDWALLSSISFWLMLGLILVPGIFGWKKSGWLQAAGAASLSVFILTLPALYGLHTRSRMAVALAHDTPLLLTPTHQGQVLGKLADGETARLLKTRGEFCYVRASTQTGWVSREKLGFIAE